MRPPFSYFGGKTRMAPWIASLMPDHRVYMEPFFGSGAVLFARAPAPIEIVNDRDGAVVAFFRALRDTPAELELACATTPFARDEYEAANLDHIEDLTDIEIGRRFFLRLCASVTKTHGRRTGFSVTTAKTQAPPRRALEKMGRFAEVAARLASVTIENTDGAELVERLATVDTLVYADPPYPAATRNATTASGAQDYRTDMTSEASHRRLAGVLRASPGAVMLSSYPSPLYDELYEGWWRIDRPTTLAGAPTTRGRPKSRAIEVLWSNRELEEGRLAI